MIIIIIITFIIIIFIIIIFSLLSSVLLNQMVNNTYLVKACKVKLLISRKNGKKNDENDNNW